MRATKTWTRWSFRSKRVDMFQARFDFSRRAPPPDPVVSQRESNKEMYTGRRTLPRVYGGTSLSQRPRSDQAPV